MKYTTAIAASLIVAFSLTIITAVLSSGGRIYISEVDWSMAENMKYADAQAYLLEKTTEIGRLDSLKNAVHYPEFWVSSISRFLSNFFLCFLACWLYIRLAKPNKSV